MRINLSRLIVGVIIFCVAAYLIGILWGMGTARAEEYFTADDWDINWTNDISLQIDPIVTHTIGIWAMSRDELIKVMKEFYGAWGEGSFGEVIVLSIEVGDYTEEYPTPADVPMGSIYLMNGNWLIFYEQNKGYQDLWRGVKE